MKRVVRTVSLLSLIIFVLTVSKCSEKGEDTNADCKICKALGVGPDQQTIQKEVCTAEEEKAFRNANAGREISCN